MNNNREPILQCTALVREFKQGSLKTPVLNGIDFSIATGEQVAIMGSSGSGKTTLLHLLGGLDTPTSGTITIAGQKLHDIAERKKCELRNQYLGFIYQFHHLLPEFTALENVTMPLLLGGIPHQKAQVQAADLLDTVGLGKRCKHKVAALSGGERQRVAIARALVRRPHCVLADEPTGNLDNKTAGQVYDLMQSLHRNANTAFILVTHDQKLAARMDKIYFLENGRLNVRQ